MLMYENAFSPFARKVRIVMELKGLDAEFVDGLNRDNQGVLGKVNGRLEVPVLVDGEVVVINSADIVAYLDYQYPRIPVFPSDPVLRVNARKWERIADTLVDPIIVNISYWHWADRDDEMPEGMLEAARHDLTVVYDQLESELLDREFICGDLSIADIALFPHLAAASRLGVPFSSEHHPKLASWLNKLGKNEVFSADVKRTWAYLCNIDGRNVERRKIFWRGERVEWLLARGFESWFFREIDSGRAIWPPQEIG